MVSTSSVLVLGAIGTTLGAYLVFVILIWLQSTVCFVEWLFGRRRSDAPVSPSDPCEDPPPTSPLAAVFLYGGASLLGPLAVTALWMSLAQQGPILGATAWVFSLTSGLVAATMGYLAPDPITYLGFPVFCYPVSCVTALASLFAMPA